MRVGDIVILKKTFPAQYETPKLIEGSLGLVFCYPYGDITNPNVGIKYKEGCSHTYILRRDLKKIGRL